VSTRLLLAAIGAIALTLAGCGNGDEPAAPVASVAPISVNAGIQATGTLDGKRVAISRGNPIVTLGDCDPEDGPDVDLCIAARTIDGLDVTLVIENPAILQPGVTLTADNPTCFRGCDAEADVIVALIRTLRDELRVASGTFEVREAGPRYIADFDITLPFGDRLIGTFDVALTPLDESTEAGG
jgi:hypothetical protein